MSIEQAIECIQSDIEILDDKIQTESLMLIEMVEIWPTKKIIEKSTSISHSILINTAIREHLEVLKKDIEGGQ